VVVAVRGGKSSSIAGDFKCGEDGVLNFPLMRDL
jgi:hypothetical protein